MSRRRSMTEWRIKSVLRKHARALLLRRGGFHIDPWQPVERALITHAHGDHARPGSAAYLVRRSRRSAPAAAASAPTRAIETRPVWRSPSRSATFASASIPPATCSDRRRSGSRPPMASGSWRATTSAPRIRPARRSSRSLRHLHHRIDLRPADLPLGRHRRRHRRHHRRGGRRTPRAGRTSVLFCYTHRQGAAAARRADARDRQARVRARHDAGDDRGLPRSGRPRCCRCAPVIERARGARRGVLRRRARAGTVIGSGHAVDAAPRRHLRRIRVWPDARARRPAAARFRPRLHPVRSRRLAGAVTDNRRYRRGACVRNPWLRRSARALSGPSAGCEAGVMRTAWEGETAPAIDAMKRFAALYDAIDRDDLHQRQGRRHGRAIFRRLPQAMRRGRCSS